MKTKEAIKLLKEKGYKIEEPKEIKTLKVGNLEITYPIEHTETYDKIEVPKGFRLPELWELFYIMHNCKEIREWEKEKWLVFYSKSDFYHIKNNNFSVLYRYRVLNLCTRDRYLASSNEDGRVIFIKEDLK